LQVTATAERIKALVERLPAAAQGLVIPSRALPVTREDGPDDAP
jgi:hypothetical protein